MSDTVRILDEGELGPTSPCGECGEPVVRIPTAATGNPLALDPSPSEEGTIALEERLGGELATIPVLERQAGRRYYRAHFLDCHRATHQRKAAE